MYFNLPLSSNSTKILYEVCSYTTLLLVCNLSMYKQLLFNLKKNQIISVNTTTGMSNSFSLDREPPFEIEYTYSVEWKPTDVSPKKRLSLLKDYRFLDCITKKRFRVYKKVNYF